MCSAAAGNGRGVDQRYPRIGHEDERLAPDRGLRGAFVSRGLGGNGGWPERATGAAKGLLGAGSRRRRGTGWSAPSLTSLGGFEKKTLGVTSNHSFTTRESFVFAVHPVAGAHWEKGELGAVEVEMEGGQLDMVPMEHARLSFHDVKVDAPLLLEQGKLRTIGTCTARGQLIVAGTGLDAAIKSRAKDLKIEEPHLVVRGDLVCFSALVKTLIIKNRVSTAGRFEIDELGHLVYHPQRLTVGILPLPSIALNAIARRINPLADVSNLRAASRSAVPADQAHRHRRQPDSGDRGWTRVATGGMTAAGRRPEAWQRGWNR